MAAGVRWLDISHGVSLVFLLLSVEDAGMHQLDMQEAVLQMAAT